MEIFLVDLMFFNQESKLPNARMSTHHIKMQQDSENHLDSNRPEHNSYNMTILTFFRISKYLCQNLGFRSLIRFGYMVK